MQNAFRIGLVVVVVEGVLIGLLVLGPAEYRPLLAVVIVGGLALNAVFLVWGIRSDRAAAMRIAAAHPGAAVRLTSLTRYADLSRSERRHVIALVADRAGLSFRDRSDVEVLGVPADRILELELAPLEGRTPLRPARVTQLDGPVVEFSAGAGPDQQLETVVALRRALGRPAG